jgi:hypothetical protein
MIGHPGFRVCGTEFAGIQLPGAGFISPRLDGKFTPVANIRRTIPAAYFWKPMFS